MVGQRNAEVAQASPCAGEHIAPHNEHEGVWPVNAMAQSVARLHSASKASRVQMGRGNGCPVFKEYCRPYRLKNSDRARKLDFGAFKATRSSTAPNGVINDSAYSRMAVSSAARTTLWPPSTVACSHRALQ